MNLSLHSATGDDMTTSTPPTTPPPLVFGATGMVGELILRRLAAAGRPPVGASRNPPANSEFDWITAELPFLDAAALPPLHTVFSAGPAVALSNALPTLAARGMQRLVVFTSTSLETKRNTDDPDEREMIRRWAEAERRIIDFCATHAVACTVLRPTLIYREGRDANVSRIAALIRRFHFFPLAGGGEGLRQPVHADDLAEAAITAADRAICAGKIYNLPGGETLTYRDMVGRIFDGLGRPRLIVPVPGWVWRLVVPVLSPFLPGISGAIVARMGKDMTFDSAPAQAEIGWQPRPFRPDFRKQ